MRKKRGKTEQPKMRVRMNGRDVSVWHDAQAQVYVVNRPQPFGVHVVRVRRL